MTTPTTDGTWLPLRDAAKAANVTEKALRRRIERGTVTSELRDDGRRHVLLQSVTGERPTPAPRDRDPGMGQIVARLEELSAENGRLRALTAIAESTERRLADELHEQRARVRELEALEQAIATAGMWRAWRLARQHRR